jgi:hypothetical protein
MTISPQSRRKLLPQALLLTGLFVGLYFALRAIPASQCGFLHYEAVEILEDGSERCEGGAPPFINLRRKPFPVELELLDKRTNDDGSLQLRFELRGPDNRPILPHQLAITHTERIHLMLVDDSLSVYHHLHPQAEGDSGIYSVRFHPQASEYRYFAEFVPLRSRQKAIADGTFSVPANDREAINETSDRPAQLLPNATRVELRGTGQTVRRNRDTTLTLRLQDEVAADQSPDLQLIMGAYAHVVAFEETLSGYQHMHPISPDPRRLDGLEMDFIFHPTLPGNYRIWVQIMLEDKEFFIPFEAQVM